MEASAAREVSPQVMIVGGGFDGLRAAKELAGAVCFKCRFQKVRKQDKNGERRICFGKRKGDAMKYSVKINLSLGLFGMTGGTWR
jgi:hypothetical protein